MYILQFRKMAACVSILASCLVSPTSRHRPQTECSSQCPREWVKSSWSSCHHVIMSSCHIFYPGWVRLHLNSSTSISPGHISILKTYSRGINHSTSYDVKDTLFVSGWYSSGHYVPSFPKPQCYAPATSWQPESGAPDT